MTVKVSGKAGVYLGMAILILPFLIQFVALAFYALTPFLFENLLSHFGPLTWFSWPSIEKAASYVDAREYQKLRYAIFLSTCFAVILSIINAIIIVVFGDFKKTEIFSLGIFSRRAWISSWSFSLLIIGVLFVLPSTYLPDLTSWHPKIDFTILGQFQLGLFAAGFSFFPYPCSFLLFCFFEIRCVFFGASKWLIFLQQCHRV